MGKSLSTIFQDLNKVLSGGWGQQVGTLATPTMVNPSTSEKGDIIYTTNNKSDYIRKKTELSQQRFLSSQWIKANVESAIDASLNTNNVKLMYRDAELMDSYPEIGAALDIVSEECCVISDSGTMLNIYSKSERIKAI